MMHRNVAQFLMKRNNRGSLRRKLSSLNQFIDVSPEVSRALEMKQPLVALESTIITHGMPYPTNLSTAIRVEEIIRSQGAVPATIAIIAGRIKVGLDPFALQELAEMKTPAIKTSRRDFSYVLSNKLNGGTTVSGTIIVADILGIPIFVTGGIGGVHRNGELSLDVSADLNELGRSRIAVVSSGVKSILDIGRTLEYLETQGVCVVSYGPSKRFPAFYARDSGFEAPYNVTTPLQAAAMIHALCGLRLDSGLLLAVPIPEKHAISEETGSSKMEEVIQNAIKEAGRKGISGKELTPFLLSKVNALTEGKSLQANIALIENNALVGGQVAVELSKLRGASPMRRNADRSSSREVTSHLSPVVIGGSGLDCVITVDEDDITLDGRTHQGEITQAGGGVGRNMADALGKLGADPFLLSAVGSDQYGSFLLQNTLQHLDCRGVCVLPSESTACYNVVLDRAGECRLGVGDMRIHEQISPALVSKFSDKLVQSSLVVMDGNIPSRTIDYALDLCKEAAVPVWYEPTDVKKASKPYHSERWKSLKFVSPNFSELKIMSQAIGLQVNMELNIAGSDVDALLAESVTLGRELARFGNTVIITLGSLGVMIVRSGLPNEPFYENGQLITERKSQVTARFYPVKRETSLVNVSGAGDCFASGFVMSMLGGSTEAECVSSGQAASLQALRSMSAVPRTLTAGYHASAPYTTML